MKYSTDIITKAKNTKLLICDVDGVLSNGHLYYSKDDEPHIAFHVHDGVGLKLLKHTGVQIAVISTGKSEIVAKRMKWLGIKQVFLGIENKLPVLQELLKKHSLSYEDVACIGDDVLDLSIFNHCGFKIAVSNAIHEIIDKAHLVTQKAGGNGAVREICDLIMLAQNTKQLALNKMSIGV